MEIIQQTRTLSAERRVVMQNAIDKFKAEVRKELGVQSNADRIRSMSDEELYNLIEKVKMCGGLLRTEESSSECKGCKDGFCCNVLHWLKSEAE